MEIGYCFFSLLVFYCVITSAISESNKTQSTEDDSSDEYDPKVEAQALHNATYGLGTDEDTIVRVFTKHKYAELLVIAKEYEKLYNRSLKEDLADDLSGNFRDVVMALMDNPYLLLAKDLHNALTSRNIDYGVINQILPVGDEISLPAILYEYQLYYNKTLLKTLREVFKGEILEFYELLLTPPFKNRFTFKKDEVLFQVKYIPFPNGTLLNVTTFMTILAKESDEQLRHICYRYELKHKEITVEDALEKAYSEPLLSTYRSIIKFIKGPQQFYADLFHNATSGIGTDDKTLIRLIIAPKFLNMNEIRVFYRLKYKKPLRKLIEEETSGDYRKLLLGLIGNEELYRKNQASVSSD